MKRVKYLLFSFILFFLIVNNVDAAIRLDQIEFEVGETYVFDEDSTITKCETKEENVIIFKSPDENACYITATAPGIYEAYVAMGDSVGVQVNITVNERTEEYSQDFISLNEFAGVINDSDISDELKEDMMSDDSYTKPEDATKFILQSVAHNNILYVNIGYDVANEVLKINYDDTTKRITFYSTKNYDARYVGAVFQFINNIPSYSVILSPKYDELMSLDFTNEAVMEHFSEESFEQKYGYVGSNLSASTENGMSVLFDVNWYLSKEINSDIIDMYYDIQHQLNNPVGPDVPVDDGTNPKTGIVLNISVIVVLLFSIIVIKIKNKASIFKI